MTTVIGQRQQRRGEAPEPRGLRTRFELKHGSSPSPRRPWAEAEGGGSAQRLHHPQPAHPFTDQRHRRTGAIDGRRQPALGDHVQPVADLEQLFQLLAHHQHRAARVAQRQDLAADLGRSADVDAPGGLRHDQQLRVGVDLAPDDEFLQVAARQRLGRRIGPSGLDVEAADDFQCLLLQRPDLDPAALADGIGAGEHEVVRQPERGHGAAAQPLLGHEMHAQLAPRGAGPRRAGVLAEHLDRGCGRARVFTRQRIQQFLLAVARDAGNAHHFAGPHFEEMPSRSTPNWSSRGRCRSCTFSTTSPASARMVLQRRRLRADHHAAERGIGFRCGLQTPVTLPPRSTVQALHSSRISCSLWLM